MMKILVLTSLRYHSTQHEITTGTYSYDQSSRCAAADPSITFPVLAGGATQDSLTTIRDQVSGVMVRSGGLASVPLSLGASLREAAVGPERPTLNSCFAPLRKSRLNSVTPQGTFNGVRTQERQTQAIETMMEYRGRRKCEQPRPASD